MVNGRYKWQILKVLQAREKNRAYAGDRRMISLPISDDRKQAEAESASRSHHQVFQPRPPPPLSLSVWDERGVAL